jgi:hypothetical protein
MHAVLRKVKELNEKSRKGQNVIVAYDLGGGNDVDDLELYAVVRFDDNSVTLKRPGQREKVLFKDKLSNVRKVFLAKKGWARKLSQATQNKSPKNKRRHLGIEIEFISRLDASQILLAMVEAGLEKYICLKEDGSIDTNDEYPHEHEICVLVNETEMPKIMKRVCKVLQGHSSVNRSCGLHVHLDMRHRDLDRAYANLFEAQPLLYSMCPKSRRTGTYSQLEEYYSLASEFDGHDRYFGINRVAYQDHRTLEVRVHSGTIVANKIIYWAKFLIRIVDRRRSDVYDVQICKDYKQLKRGLRLPRTMDRYIKRRIDKFKADHTGTDVEVAA